MNNFRGKNKMKLYELLKDLPTFKADDVFYLDSNNNLRHKWSDIMAYNHKTLEKFPNILKDWFKEIHERKRSRVGYGESYYYISDSGAIECNCDYRDSGDDYLYSTGNYGRTKEELEAKREYNIANRVLLDDADGGKWVEDDSNWHVFYGCTNFVITSSAYYKPGTIYFQSVKALQKSLEEHKEQWEFVRKYEMGEM